MKLFQARQAQRKGDVVESSFDRHHETVIDHLRRASESAKLIDGVLGLVLVECIAVHVDPAGVEKLLMWPCVGRWVLFAFPVFVLHVHCTKLFRSWDSKDCALRWALNLYSDALDGRSVFEGDCV